MEVIIIAAFLGIITGFIGQNKGRSFGLWYFYGFMLFIVALPHSLLMKDRSGAQCPKCKEFVPAGASVCKFCRSDI